MIRFEVPLFPRIEILFYFIESSQRNVDFIGEYKELR